LLEDAVDDRIDAERRRVDAVGEVPAGLPVSGEALRRHLVETAATQGAAVPGHDDSPVAPGEIEDLLLDVRRDRIPGMLA
jgi:hypothetical protein